MNNETNLALQSLKTLLDSLQEKRKRLFSEVDIMNESLIDYQHHIELGNLDAVSTMKLVKSMKTMLLARRIKKDQLQVLSSLTVMPNASTFNAKLQAAVEQLHKREGWNYKPRHVSIQQAVGATLQDSVG